MSPESVLRRAWASRGPAAWALAPLAAVFAAAVALRRVLYRTGILAAQRLPVPVVVVGNIAVGGTGKTPTVIALAERLRARGVAAHAVTRGYGGTQAAPLRVRELKHRAAQVGDEAFFYHSREGLEIVGICTVSVAGITDPTDESGKWAAVKIKPKAKLAQPVTLVAIKAEPRLSEMQLIKQSRLSVCGISPAEWAIIGEMAQD